MELWSDVICQSIHLSVSLSVVSVYLPVCLFVCMCVCLSIYPSALAEFLMLLESMLWFTLIYAPVEFRYVSDTERFGLLQHLSSYI